MASGDIITQNGRGQWLRFSKPRRVHVATTVSGVEAVLREVDVAISEGVAVAGYMAYEAAGGLDPVLSTHQLDGIPLVWFGEYAPPELLDSLPLPQQEAPSLSWESSLSDSDYASAIARIKRYIRSGDTYQVNFTVRLHSQSVVAPYALFCQLQSAQQSNCAAYVDLGHTAICSVSPELFFEIAGDEILVRPMKGTARRGVTSCADDLNALSLAESEKDRAENVMIVDMIRNDIGRIADPGTVKVTRLFDIERYPTVHQMTSTVVGRTQESLSALMHALFPCASITGAPKVRTMQIIRELEDSARGVYTGSIGYWLPDRQARFNVAIRTVVVDRRDGAATYGVGGGIVWDSVDHQELSECLTKAEVLNTVRSPFEILETLLWTVSDGFYLLDRHVARAAASAHYFGYAFDAVQMREQLAKAVAKVGEPKKCRVRWLLSCDGDTSAEVVPLAAVGERPLRVGVAFHSCDSSDPFLYHKTTNRSVYVDARSAYADCDDVLLVNERGELTESTIANLVVEIEGERITPPVSSGLLAGTLRAELLERGEIREAVITPDMLYAADAVFLINSVRKWMPACVV
jgi:para-aminobenzoate synthetase / 4-amino-4-deoxychorismate lyase